MDQRKIGCILLLFIQLACWGQNADKQSLVHIGKQFLGRPYRGNMLSSSNPEIFVTSQDAFDCVTFLEHCLAIKIANENPDQFESALKHVRYAADSVQFEKRYHYFSDAMWQLGYPPIQDPLHHSIAPKDFSFLSKYLIRKFEKSVNIDLIANKEKQLKSRVFTYTSIKDLSFILPLIHDGDLIGLVGKNNHLDFLHTAMAIRKGSQIYLLHASQEKKKVIISDQPLADYLKSHHQFIGISVFRPKFNK